jgi:hypothetical protein
MSQHLKPLKFQLEEIRTENCAEQMSRGFLRHRLHSLEVWLSRRIKMGQLTGFRAFTRYGPLSQRL